MKLSPDFYQQFISPRKPKAFWLPLALLLAAAGIAAFLLGIRGEAQGRFWQAYLINFVFWSGISFGSVFFVAILNMTNARWGRPLKRLAEALGSFLPVCFLLFWLAYPGRQELFPWVLHPVEEKQAWLNVPFFFIREGVGILLLTTTAMLLLFYSGRSDIRMARQLHRAGSGGKEAALSPHPPGSEENRDWRAQGFLSPVFAALYVLILTMLSWDLIMSLDPTWYSTLFGAYYFIGSLYSGLAALALLSVWACSDLDLQTVVQERHFHDLGKMLGGIMMLTGDFFFSQYLLIWYGNLPKETEFLILRFRFEPWHTITLIVAVMIFAVPFIMLLSRRIKRSRLSMAAISAVILVGMWLERFLLIAPSLWKSDDIPLGFPEALTSLGFLGMVGVCVLLFLRIVPALPLSDPLFRKNLEASSLVSSG